MQQVTSHLEEIMEKINDIDRLPTYEETRHLIQAISRNEGGIRSKLRSIYPTYNIYNVEFVDRLADVINGINEHPVIEICAGSGKLSHQLRKRGVDIKATDDYSLDLIERKEYVVEKASHEQALQKYQPRTVVGAWIPNRTKIGFDVLDFPTVKFVIDIGEGSSGAGWRTWDLYNRKDLHVAHLADVEKYSCSFFKSDAVLLVKLEPPTNGSMLNSL